MEPEVVAFLKRIGMSLFIALIWLAINATAAIKNDNAFIEGPVRTANVLFYIWFVISLLILIYIYRKMWFNK